ncbi:MAG: type II toxin-antitoxin system Phd/YefM family antitoxin [Candidatus Scalindua sp.]|nr:type II toxin-antitoxin system Phd/YefM family antitoxin [Candidatus Scalindua sp.]
MTININENILSITELKKNTHKILKQIHSTHRPVVLTVNGKAEAVLVDAIQYEKMVQAFNMAKKYNIEITRIIRGSRLLKKEMIERALRTFIKNMQ